MATALPLFDPLQMWRDMITRVEQDLNAAATGSTRSPEMVRALHQATGLTQGVEQLFAKSVEAYLKRANLPSRREVAALAEALQRIEQKLDRLLPDEQPEAPRPKRTKQAPSRAAGADAAAPVAARPGPAVPAVPPAPAARPVRAKRKPAKR